MRRILLLAATLTVALPAAASEAAVIPSVSGGTLTVTGDAAADQITLRLTSPTTLDVNGVPFQRGTFSKVAIRSGAGDDTIRIADPLTEPLTIESGAGADAVTGSAGAESIATGDDADLVHPGGGDDSVALGNGDDTVIQGDGFDQLDGQLGKDTLQAIGSDESEEFTVQANGAKLRVSRDTGPTSDAAGVEALDVVASGGQDLVDLGDLRPTELLSLDADLGAADGARDQIAIQGTDGFDNINTRAFLDDVRVEGLDADIRVRNAAVNDDRMTIFGRGNVDFIVAEDSAAARIAITLDGGAGIDVLDGSDQADTLRGGPDGDVVTGGRGNDTIDLGDGDDRFSRSRADGTDHVEGGAGNDRLVASGTEADDFIDVLGLLTTTRVLYGFEGSAELRGVETLDLAPFGGTDNVKVGDLTGTATKTVNVNSNTADLRVDTITATGSPAAETIRASTSGTTHTITGLAATVNVTNPEQGEKIAIDARDGADTIDATGVTKDKLQPILKGGAGNDTIVGTTGQDLVSGGTGTDVVLLGAGLDTVDVEPRRGERHHRGRERHRLPADDRLGRQRPLRRHPGREPHPRHARHRERQPGHGRPRAARHRARPRRRPRPGGRHERHQHRPRGRRAPGRAGDDERRQPHRPRVRGRHVRQRHHQCERRRARRPGHRHGGDRDHPRHRPGARPAARRHEAGHRPVHDHRHRAAADRRDVLVSGGV